MVEHHQWRAAGRRFVHLTGPASEPSVTAGSPTIVALSPAGVTAGRRADLLLAAARGHVGSGGWQAALEACSAAAWTCRYHGEYGVEARAPGARVVLVHVAYALLVAAMVEGGPVAGLDGVATSALGRLSPLLERADAAAQAVVEGLLHAAAGRDEKAVDVLTAAVAAHPAGSDAAATLLALAAVHVAAGRPAPQAHAAVRLLRVLERCAGPGAPVEPFLSGALVLVARDALVAGELTRALNGAQMALGAVRSGSTGPAVARRRRAYEVLSEVLGALGRHPEALAAAVRAVEPDASALTQGGHERS